MLFFFMLAVALSSSVEDFGSGICFFPEKLVLRVYHHVIFSRVIYFLTFGEYFWLVVNFMKTLVQSRTCFIGFLANSARWGISVCILTGAITRLGLQLWLQYLPMFPTTENRISL